MPEFPSAALLSVNDATASPPSAALQTENSGKPYNNTLTPLEQDRLKKMYDAAEGEGNKILERVLRKYGAYKLDMSQAASLGTTTRSMYKPDSQEGRVVRPKAVIEKWPRYVIM